MSKRQFKSWSTECSEEAATKGPDLNLQSANQRRALEIKKRSQKLPFKKDDTQILFITAKKKEICNIFLSFFILKIFYILYL